MLFRNGVKVEDYDGGRTADEIVEYMLKQVLNCFVPFCTVQH